MTISVKKYNLGHFLKKHHIKKAFQLIQKQLGQRTYTFKTIDLQIYRKEHSCEVFDAELFYNHFVAKDLFYNYRDIFYNIEYFIPKGAYGIRRFNFTSFNLIVLYYSLGFYFLELLKDFLDKIETVKKELKNIRTFYGGRLVFDNPNKSEIYYQQDYSAFNNGIKQNIRAGLSQNKKVCITKLDIQDFYGSIKTTLLLEIIEKYSVASTIEKLHYDNNAKKSIVSFLLFCNKKDYGLPLSAQNVISNFISNIFLFELDNFIQKLPLYEEDGFSYFRYVDDFYLIFYRDLTVKNDSIGEEIFEISTSISDFLASKLDLKVNHLKSKNWIIENNDDYQEFLTKEKFTSFADPLKSKNPDTKNPKQRLEEACIIIEKLKSDFVKKGKTKIDEDQDIALKEIFISSIKQYVRSKEAKINLDKAFEDWNPILTLNSIKALMFLVGNSSTGYNIIQKYLMTNFKTKIKKTQNVSLLEKFVNTESYDNSLDQIIIESKKSPSFYFSLVQRMVSGKPDHPKKYIPIEDDILIENDSLTQQIKMMVLAEEEKKYNVAFNHLLNTFHLYCYIKDNNKKVKSIKYYDQNHIVNFLTEKKASIDEIKFVISFFDRRNKNTISHPGDELIENWVVNKKEYKNYLKQMIGLIERKIK